MLLTDVKTVHGGETGCWCRELSVYRSGSDWVRMKLPKGWYCAVCQDVGCSEVAECVSVWLHSLLVRHFTTGILASHLCVCELGMHFIVLAADDCMSVGVCKWTCVNLWCVCVRVVVVVGWKWAVSIMWYAFPGRPWATVIFTRGYMIIPPQSQKSSSSLCCFSPTFIKSQMAAFFFFKSRIAYSSVML